MMRSGHCIDRLCHKCTWPRCDHDCHTRAAEMVAQTFDPGAINARMVGEKTAQQECLRTPTGPDPLTELAESRMT